MSRFKIKSCHGENVIADKCSDIIGKNDPDLGKDEEKRPLIPYTNDERNNKYKQQHGVTGEIFFSHKPQQARKQELAPRYNSAAYGKKQGVRELNGEHRTANAHSKAHDCSNNPKHDIHIRFICFHLVYLTHSLLM
ncbi:MAG: hypothetical protein IIV43_03745 [Oscillospiraceae bacterium]|nr:hypothetical protein [Oscillospiraceae bacterium]